MKPSIEALKQALKEKGIGLSHQRLQVLDYLCRHLCHPTADEVYLALKRDMPTLSKTTVYNTLRLLAEAGLVKALSIEGNETRFDIRGREHGHFKCLSCGAIADVPLDMPALSPGFLSGWEVRETDVFFRGRCPACASGDKKE